MVATLRVMLDQVATPVDPDLSEASAELVRALIAATPDGCEVEGIAPAGGRDLDIAGLAGLRRTALARRELAAALQMGIGTGIGGGMIHSPTLFAPLVRHDRVHDHDQTVVTVWDLRPWEAPEELPKQAVAWHRAMLKRAVKHADAVVVPTHAMGRRLGEIARLGDRIRVVSGASPHGFAVPSDEVGRRRTMGLPEGYVLMSGGAAPSDGLDVGFAAVRASDVDLPVVIVGAPDGAEPAIADVAAAAGIAEHRLHVRGSMDGRDRAAVYGAALAFLAPSRRAAFAWRTVDALTLGVPMVAASTEINREVVLDGGWLVDGVDRAELAEGMGDALGHVLESTAAAERASVLASDRGRAFSWRDAADRIWMLHAEL